MAAKSCPLQSSREAWVDVWRSLRHYASGAVGKEERALAAAIAKAPGKEQEKGKRCVQRSALRGEWR
eukprot:6259224-Prymnesium_polylepis.2